MDKIGTFENEDVVIDTCKVTDGFKPYETLIIHHLYHEGKSIIVEAYATRDEAVIGHTTWIDRMTVDPLPESLSNCSNDPTNLLAEILGCDVVFPLKRK